MEGKPTQKMLIAVKTIAWQRGDWKNTFIEVIHKWSYDKAHAYIAEYGRQGINA